VDHVSRRALQERRVAVPPVADETTIEIVSCGAPLPNVSLQIRSASGDVLADRMVGEVVLRSDCMFREYYGEPASNDVGLRNGWLHTGDLGYTSGGELYICGRCKDTIIVGGVNVQAEDIELSVAAVAGLHPGRIVAFGVPDSHLGTESIVVVAELKRESDVDRQQIEFNLRRRVQDEIGVAVGPVELVPAGWIVKTTSGKLARWENRSKWLAAQAAVTS